MVQAIFYLYLNEYCVADKIAFSQAVKWEVSTLLIALTLPFSVGIS